MARAWKGDGSELEIPPAGPMGIVRAVLRGIPLVILVFGTLAVLLLVRLVERPLCGQHRPWTPSLTVFVCRNALRILGIKLHTSGEVMREHGAIVANHSSWLDIFVLNASKRIYFVSKAEVAGWPGIGLLARATGTVFVERNPKLARAQRDLLVQRLSYGHKLLFFPEGTSTDGRRVLKFKSTLFDAMLGGKEPMMLQPVSVHYQAPAGQDPRFYGWWGDMSFGQHFMAMLAAPRHGRVDVHYHTPISVADFADRKALAAAAEEVVAAELTARIAAEGLPA